MMLSSLAARGAALLAMSALVLSLLASGRGSAEEPVFNPAQEDAIRTLVRDYLLDNPDVLVEALELYRAQQELVSERRKREAVVAERAALEQDPDSPVLGNPEGDVVIVEFFDYRCPYCKRAADTLFEVVRNDGNIRLVMKEYPILGPESLYAAQVALAAGKQGKYEEFHFTLMRGKGKVDEPGVLAAAESIGLDVEQLKRDMRSADVDQALRKNYELADALDIGGTPAFVIGDTLVPGAIDRKTLLELVAKERSG